MHNQSEHLRTQRSHHERQWHEKAAEERINADCRQKVALFYTYEQNPAFGSQSNIGGNIVACVRSFAIADVQKKKGSRTIAVVAKMRPPSRICQSVPAKAPSEMKGIATQKKSRG